MTIARILVIGLAVMFASAVGTAAFDAVYAAQSAVPCCNWVGGKYINLKTGKPVTPPKAATGTQSGRTGSGRK
jgi:hypothetical protein